MMRLEVEMVRYRVFKSDELRQTYGSAGITDAVEAASRDATAWMNENEGKVKVRHVSTGLTSVYAYVTVWYE
jgi:hypothetical protein